MREMDPSSNPDAGIPEGNFVLKKIIEPNCDTADILPILKPKLINSFAWREILEHQIHAESPLTFSIDLENGNAIISNEDFLRANYYSAEQTSNFLDEMVGILEKAKSVFLGRRMGAINP
jgi:hypothetical protein